MPRLLISAAAAAAVGAALALSAPVGGRASSACGASAYAYAGVLGLDSAHGVSATIVPLAAPQVRGGHVAAWVGAGGEGQGPNGSDEWLQAGLGAEPDKGVFLYYELALPGAAPRVVMLKGHLPEGRSYRISVLEARGRASRWSVWVNGNRLTRRIYLPGSHGAWRPTVTTESWNGGVGACNTYSFEFANVRAAVRSGGAWVPMRSQVIDEPGYSVIRHGRASFVADGGS